MSSELKQVLANAVQNALSATQNSGVEDNKLNQDEIDNIYEEALEKTPELKTKADNLSSQDKEAFEMLSQEKTNASEQADKDTNILKDAKNWICGLFKKETKDGEIGETKQNQTGDCWLLSGVNSLSYTEKGREIIKNALEYEDGYTTVSLKGIDEDYKVVVSDEEVAATKKIDEYSSGDDDMIIFELAIEKTFNDIANGELVIDPNSPWYMETQQDLREDIKENSSSIWAGYSAEAMTLLTGKISERINDKAEIRSQLENIEKNGNKNIALGASVGGEYIEEEYFNFDDVNGKSHKMASGHAYSIKSIENSVVTVINPWNSGDEIPINMDDFLDMFASIDVCDLSDKNEETTLASNTFEVDDEGNKVYEFESSLDGFDKQIQTYSQISDENDASIKIKDTFINEQMNESLVYEYSEEGNAQRVIRTNDTTKDSLIYELDEEGNVEEVVETVHFYSDGGKESSHIEYHKNSSGALEYKNCYDADGNLESVMKYNEKGEFVSQTNYDEYGNVLEVVTK